MIKKLKWAGSAIFLIASAAYLSAVMVYTIYVSFEIFRPFIAVGACLMGLYACSIAKDRVFGRSAQKD